MRHGKNVHGGFGKEAGDTATWKEIRMNRRHINGKMLMFSVLAGLAAMIRPEAQPATDAAGTVAQSSRPKVIFDTDMTGDCDDCGALAVLHALADMGEVDILGCIASYGANPYVAGCVDAINTYYGRGDLPIGAEKAAYGRTESHYLEAIATDTARYGHDIVTKADAPDPVPVYRRLLADAPDNSVTIVTIGRLKALCDLLESEPDKISDFDGIALVKKKAVRWVCMGGRYPGSIGKPEANFVSFGGAGYSKKAVDLWPKQALFTGFEIGSEIMTGQELVKDSADNPVARAYRIFFDKAKLESRQSWDQTAVLLAVRGPDPFWDLVTGGGNVVHEDGINEWRAAPDCDHAYIVEKTDPAMAAETIEKLMTRPPASAAQDDRPGRLRREMVDRDIAGRSWGSGRVTDKAVIAAMAKVPRHEFVPETHRSSAYGDYPLPIGFDQTISQPFIVAAMTQLLEGKKTDRILEIGTGSGYQAAVLAEIVREVYTIEIVPELAARAKSDLARLGYDNVHVRAGDGYQGWPEKAPFDGIIVTAAPDEVPEPLIEQLKTGGRMVIPVGPAAGMQYLKILIRREDGRLQEKSMMPVRFVPFLRDSIPE
jgi:protein-L-isoaspartate(D-aspartate) O-methyltransferase